MRLCCESSHSSHSWACVLSAIHLRLQSSAVRSRLPQGVTISGTDRAVRCPVQHRLSVLCMATITTTPMSRWLWAGRNKLDYGVGGRGRTHRIRSGVWARFRPILTSGWAASSVNESLLITGGTGTGYLLMNFAVEDVGGPQPIAQVLVNGQCLAPNPMISYSCQMRNEVGNEPGLFHSRSASRFHLTCPFRRI